MKRQSGGETIPLGLVYLAAAAREAGHQVNILDAEIRDLDTIQTVKEIVAVNPDLVGFTAVTISIDNAAAVAKEIKEQHRHILTVVGGHHLSTMPSETLLRYPDFDIGVIGEGEKTLVELLAVIEHSGCDTDKLQDVHGLIFKEPHSDEFVTTPPRARTIQLDSLPKPAFDLLPDLSQYSPPAHTVRQFPACNLVTSRGCPGQCTFCTRSVYGNVLSSHSAAYMMELVTTLHTNYGIREIQFRDDNFTVFKPRLYEFCRLMKKRRLPLVWTALARVDMVEPEMFTAMKEAGCWQIWFGVESGNDNILRIIKKNTTKEQITKSITWAHQAGISIGAFFIMGHPGETKETLQETIDFALSLPIDEFHCTLMTPMPGAEIYSTYAQYGTFENDWKKLNNWSPVFVPFGVTREELVRYNKLFFRRFYFRPRIIGSYIRRIRSLKHLAIYFSGLLALLEWITVKKSSDGIGPNG